MKKLVLVLAVLAALAPAAAAGGGWATVGLGSLPPDDLVAGAEWSVDLTVLQHGRTPLEHVQPVVRLHGPGGASEEFAATRTAKPGVYRAVVRFPSSGTWRFEVDDGFSQTHTYRPVTVGTASSPSSFPTLPVGGLAAALVLVAVLLLVARRQRPRSQPATAGG
ncbi:MAG TPA: FixH family protein [Gaiellaceae bacterium]|jgi:hypothetical protein|nr:FixH family protein [Gaiellaceae bacterium]